MDDEDVVVKPVEEETLDYAAVTKVTSKALKALEFNKMPVLVNPAFIKEMKDMAELLEEYADDLSLVKRANRDKAIKCKRIASIFTDIVNGFMNMDLSSGDFPAYFQNLKEAVADTDELFDPADVSDLDTFDASTLFALSSDQTKLDIKFFKNLNRKKGKKAKVHSLLEADVLLHVSPTISDGDLLQHNMKFRIVEGYVHFRNQQILLIDAARTTDPYDFAAAYCSEVGNKLSPLQVLYFNKTVAYAWLLPSKVIADVFSTRDVNAWCCVRNEQNE